MYGWSYETPVERAVNGIRNVNRKLSDIVLRERRRVVDMWKRVSTGVWEVELTGCLINSILSAAWARTEQWLPKKLVSRYASL